MKKILNKQFIKQFISYVLVGGISALVEWGMFFLFSNVLNIFYLLATCLAFIISTTTNYVLGRVWTFKGNKNYEKKKAVEVLLVFLVSAIGLGFNLLLMFLFVNVLKMDTNLLRMVAKILATGIVFIWNFLIRKLVIYKEK